MTDAVVRTSRAARASLVLGLLCLFFGLTAMLTGAPVLALAAFALVLPALILGIIGCIRVRRSAGWLRGEGSANGGMVATITGVLVSFMIPVG